MNKNRLELKYVVVITKTNDIISRYTFDTLNEANREMHKILQDNPGDLGHIESCYILIKGNK